MLPTNIYTTTNVTDSIATIFKTTRPLVEPSKVYQIPLDTQFPIVWAWADTNYVSFHDDNAGSVNIILNSDGSCTFGDGRVKKPQKSSTIHGYMLVIAWTIMSVCQIWTGRYLKHWWKWRQTLHAVIGGIVGLLTLAGFVIIMVALDWDFKQFNHWHNGCGIVSSFGCLPVFLGGLCVFILMKTVNLDW